MNDDLFRNNRIYADYEGEEEVIFELEEDRNMNLHIWIGYLDDILCSPDLSGAGWTGLTRDYHQLEKAFSGSGKEAVVSPDEYLDDLKQYQSRQFDAPETECVLNLIIMLLEYAANRKSKIIIRVD